MKKELQSILSVGLFLGFIITGKADYSPIVESDGDVVIADFGNSKAWKLRGKSNPKITFDSKTPQAKAAITFENQNPEEAVISTTSIAPEGEWRTKEYDKVSFMIKNNGEKGIVFLRLFVLEGGNFNILIRLPSKDKDWHRMVINLDKYIKKGFKPSDTKIFRIRTFDKINVSFGNITFIPAKTEAEEAKTD